MKKFYQLIFSASLIVSTSSFCVAQSFKVVDTLGTDISGNTIDVTGQPSDFLIEYHAYLVNTSGTTKNVNITKSYIYQTADTMTASFCWGVTCYPDFVVTSSTPAACYANDTNFTFRADGYPNNTAGIIVAKYTFFDTGNINDKVELTVRFLAGSTVVNEPVVYSFANVYPNPARDQVNFNYQVSSQVNAEIKIFDLAGNKVRHLILSNNETHQKADVSSLQSGVYFYTLYLNGKATTTKRLIISK